MKIKVKMKKKKTGEKKMKNFKTLERKRMKIRK